VPILARDVGTVASYTRRVGPRAVVVRFGRVGDAAQRGGCMRVELTVGDFLDRAAFAMPDRVAIVDEPDGPGSLGAVTYAEMHARAATLASRLDELSVAHGARVAIVSPNSARFLIAFFGVSGYGRVLVPINFRLNEAEIAYILKHSGAEVLLYDPELEGVVEHGDVALSVRLDSIDASGRPRRRRRHRRGRATRRPAARSTTRQGRLRTRRACSSPIGTAG